MTSRREFLQQTAAIAGALSPAASGIAAGLDGATTHSQEPAPRTYISLTRPPDLVAVQTTASGERTLRSITDGRWADGDLSVTIAPIRDSPARRRVELSSPSTAVRRLRLRWNGPLDDVHLIMGDAWERGYGDLEWRGFVPDRVMPWYVAASDGRVTHAYGVRTGAAAFCFWQLDPLGVTLLADVRSGGAGVELGARTLAVCDFVSRQGQTGESAFAAVHAFCRQLCDAPRLPAQPVYGSNDWYWAYGRNSAATILADAQHIVDLSPSDANRPFVVIDDGWQPERGEAKTGVGLWDRGNEKFPDMPGLAGEIRRVGARPGIWIRPLLAPSDAPNAWRLPRDRAILDPTVPEVRQKIATDIARVRQWGYDLIKHDYSTFDLFGRWGSTMGEALTRDGWTFAAGPTRTTAEVIGELYRTIRSAAGDGLIIGCNTVSHLSAGVFDVCRIGDDTSGRDWARTRKMGVNTLAFRGAQHGAFYVADADCVGVTTAIPWSLNRQWLDLLARSGTMLFVSLAPDALGADERRDLRAALALAARPQPLAEPLDWQHTTWPTRWRLIDREVTYNWFDT
jgi:alpha-galactosidase